MSEDRHNSTPPDELVKLQRVANNLREIRRAVKRDVSRMEAGWATLDALEGRRNGLRRKRPRATVRLAAHLAVTSHAARRVGRRHAWFLRSKSTRFRALRITAAIAAIWGLVALLLLVVALLGGDVVQASTWFRVVAGVIAIVGLMVWRPAIHWFLIDRVEAMAEVVDRSFRSRPRISIDLAEKRHADVWKEALMPQLSDASRSAWETALADASDENIAKAVAKTPRDQLLLLSARLEYLARKGSSDPDDPLISHLDDLMSALRASVDEDADSAGPTSRS